MRIVETTTTETVTEIIDLDLDEYDRQNVGAKATETVSVDLDDENSVSQQLIENLRRKYRSRVDQDPIESSRKEDHHTYIQPINRFSVGKYLSKSDEDLRKLKKKHDEFDFSTPKVRVISRHPVRQRSSESLSGGSSPVRPRLTRSIERINIEEKGSDDDSSSGSLDYGEVVSVTGIGSNPLRREEIEREKRRQQDELIRLETKFSWIF